MQPTVHNEAYGDFGLPGRQVKRFRHIPIAVGIGVLLIAVSQQLRTQWIAESLAHQAALGQPTFVVWGVPVYGLWRSFAWVERLAAIPAAADLVRNAALWSFVSSVLSVALSVHLIVRGIRSDKNRAGEIHGSAHWAKKDDVERAGLFAPTGIVAGKWIDKSARRVRYMRHNGGEHALVLAPTGTGKGVGLVLPTLLTWTASALVLDPKGENYIKTSGWRKSIGQRVFKLDFSAPPSETAGFNPLSAVRLRTSHEVADAQRIAGIVINPDGKDPEGNAKYFNDTAGGLLVGAILHVLYREFAKGRCASLSDVLDELTDVERTHGQVLLDWLTFPHDPAFTQGWTQKGVPSATHRVVAATARAQLNRDERDRSPILSSAVSPLALYLDPTLVANTSHSDFTIEDLMDRDEPATLYLVLPSDDNKRLRPLVRILLDLLIRRLMPPMKEVGGELVSTHKHELLLMLDEFPTLGRLDIFTESIATMRGWGLRSYLICQDYEQLRQAYGDRETISSNCQLQLAYAPNKLETAQRLSQMIGTTTIVKRARSASQSIGRFAANRNNESDQEVSRPLLSPDECMRLPGAVKRGRLIKKPGDMLVFFSGVPPIYAQQSLYFRDPTLLARSRIPAAPPKPAGKRDAPRPGPADVLTGRVQPEGATTPHVVITPCEGDVAPHVETAPTPLTARSSDAEPIADFNRFVAGNIRLMETVTGLTSGSESALHNPIGLDEELIALGAGLDDREHDDGSVDAYEPAPEDTPDEDPFADEPLLGEEDPE